MKITVTKADISNGIPEEGAFCPIALAMGRIPGVTNPTVGDIAVRFCWKTKDGIESRYRTLPPKASQFIQNFDARKPVKPISFTLPI